MRTVYGAVWDAEGLVYGETRSTPAAALLDHQDAIPVDLDHDHLPVGRVVHLERRPRELWAVAEVDDSVVPAVVVAVGNNLVMDDHPLYFSSETIGGEQDGYLMTWLSLTAFPARVNATPVRFLDGAPDHRHVPERRWNLRKGPQRDLLTRACTNRVERRTRDGITVYDVEQAAAYAALSGRSSWDAGAVIAANMLGEMRYSAPHPGSISVR